MEILSQEKEEGEMPLPLNSTYVAVGSGSGSGGEHEHMIHPHHHDHHVVSNGPIISSSNIIIDEDNINHNNNHVVTNYKKKNMVKYRECLKNHAAAMGGNATDGCGEFMPSGSGEEEGILEALTCSACNCHRNFHRKEIEGEPINYHQSPHFNRIGRKVFVGLHNHHHHHHKGILGGPDPLGYPISSRGVAPMIMSYNIGGSLLPYESDDQEEGVGGGGEVGMARVPHHQNMMAKKRFRTKFTQEQKEKMLNFAEKVGWKIQRQEEAVVQQLCQEVGIKRRVLKVWMHNNKHNLAKKNNISNIAPNQVQECDPTMK